MKHLIVLISLVFVVCRAEAVYTSFGSLSPPEHTFDTLSTNWFVAAIAVLPRQESSNALSFQQITNLLKEESDSGNTAAQALWGVALIAQSHSQQQTTEGLQLLRKSAEQGYVPAMLQLGLLFKNNKFLTRDDNEVFHWFRKAAETGDAEGQFYLGACYLYAWGTLKDPVRAAEYFRSSAQQTNYSAMKSLGYLLMNGIGVAKDREEAKYWSMRSANEGGNRRAMYNLGAICCANPSDTNAMVEAFRWFQKSADLNDSLACLELAKFYYAGWGGAETNLERYYSGD